jgi:integrase
VGTEAGTRGGRDSWHGHRLTGADLKRKQPGIYADGGGLLLQVALGKTGQRNRSWIFRYVPTGSKRSRYMGLGSVITVSLAEAREAALECRKLRLAGIDPLAHKRDKLAALRAADATAMTFKDCVRGFIRDNESSWTNPKHRAEWEKSLVKYVYPVLGSMPVAAIDTPLVLKVLKPIWATIPESASRIRGRIENVLGWATVHHYRAGDNPAKWYQHLEHALPAVVKGGHHSALPYTEIADFMVKLRQQTGVAARCLEFIILTAARLGEALGATWDEIDLQNKMWVVPGARMKAGKEHKVPLSTAAIAVLKEMAAIRQSEFVFPGSREGRPIGETAAWFLAKKVAGDSGLTVHGFRSTFRDWCAELTNYPNHVVEMALAHAIPDAVEAAYRRGDLYAKRERLMQVWSDYCAQSAAVSGTVVPLRTAHDSPL